MTDGPREVVRTEKFRIVEAPNGDKTLERYEGRDAMGGEKWRGLTFGEADATGKLLRDFLFAHTTVCPLMRQGVEE